MKFLIAIALIAAVSALPEPVSLPKAALPAFEAHEALPNAEPIELPKAELPAYEDEAIPAFEPIDISPMFVPEEVMEAVRVAQLAEIEIQPVKFVDNAELVPVDALAYDEEANEVEESVVAVQAPIDANEFAVHVVDVAENADTLAQESFAVRVVDDAVNVPASFDEQLAAGELEAIRIAFPIPAADVQAEEIVPEAVRFVDAPLRRPGKIFEDSRVR